ncbi:MAG: hypothetical protein GEU73_00380 [Chloroflexi bacterium]|nr:hypothetical protein [Chloroflexota bacterium]
MRACTDCTYLAPHRRLSGLLSASASVIAAATISPLASLLARSPARLAISRRDPFPLVGAFWVTARRLTMETVPGLVFFPGS